MDKEKKNYIKNILLEMLELLCSEGKKFRNQIKFTTKKISKEVYSISTLTKLKAGDLILC